jgi:hypothetical protein
MKKLAVLVLLAAGLVLSATPAQARGRHGCCAPCNDCCSPCSASCAAPCAPAAPTYVTQTVTCYRPEWREKEVEVTVNRMVSHENTGHRTYTVLIPEYHNEQRTATVYVPRPREVEREVTSCRMVSVQTVDCCGCCHTCCQPVMETQRVRCTIMECVPEQRQYSVQVCTYRSEQKTQEYHYTTYECRPEKVKQRVRYCEMVAYQTTVQVPVCSSSCCTPCCN